MVKKKIRKMVDPRWRKNNVVCVPVNVHAPMSSDRLSENRGRVSAFISSIENRSVLRNTQNLKAKDRARFRRKDAIKSQAKVVSEGINLVSVLVTKLTKSPKVSQSLTCTHVLF